MVVMSNYGWTWRWTLVCDVHMYTSPGCCVYVHLYTSPAYGLARVRVRYMELKVQQVILTRDMYLREYSVYASRCMRPSHQHAPLYYTLVSVRRCTVLSILWREQYNLHPTAHHSMVRRWMQVDDSTRVIRIGYHVRCVESLDAHCCYPS